MLRACKPHRTGLRDAATLVLMWRCGLRVSEVCSLEVHDLRFQTQTVRIRKPKGWAREVGPTPPRTIGMDPQTIAVIQRWTKLDDAAEGPLLYTARGRPMTRGHVYRMIKRLGQTARVKHQVHPHMFRHTFAHDLFREGFALSEIQAMLGHRSLATTYTYLQHIGATDAIQLGQNRSFTL